MRRWTTQKRTLAQCTRTSPLMSSWTPSVVRLLPILMPLPSDRFRLACIGIWSHQPADMVGLRAATTNLQL